MFSQKRHKTALEILWGIIRNTDPIRKVLLLQIIITEIVTTNLVVNTLSLSGTKTQCIRVFDEKLLQKSREFSRANRNLWQIKQRSHSKQNLYASIGPSLSDEDIR